MMSFFCRLFPLRTTAFQKSAFSQKRTRRGRRSSSEIRLTMPGFLASPSRPTLSSSALGCESWIMSNEKRRGSVFGQHWPFVINADLHLIEKTDLCSTSGLPFTHIIFPAQVARLRAPLLPGCATCPRGGGVLQPWSLGSGKALCGISASAQNSKRCCWKNVHALLFTTSV